MTHTAFLKTWDTQHTILRHIKPTKNIVLHRQSAHLNHTKTAQLQFVSDIPWFRKYRRKKRSVVEYWNNTTLIDVMCVRHLPLDSGTLSVTTRLRQRITETVCAAQKNPSPLQECVGANFVPKRNAKYIALYVTPNRPKRKKIPWCLKQPNTLPTAKTMTTFREIVGSIIISCGLQTISGITKIFNNNSYVRTKFQGTASDEKDADNERRRNVIEAPVRQMNAVILVQIRHVVQSTPICCNVIIFNPVRCWISVHIVEYWYNRN